MSAPALRISANALPSVKFPPYECDSDLAASPYFLKPAYVSSFGGSRVCLTVKTKTPSQPSMCNSMDFYKLELHVGELIFAGQAAQAPVGVNASA